MNGSLIIHPSPTSAFASSLVNFPLIDFCGVLFLARISSSSSLLTTTTTTTVRLTSLLILLLLQYYYNYYYYTPGCGMR
jgi:hypothetical protein